MKIMFFKGRDAHLPDQWVKGLGYIQRRGFNFLPAIVRLEELLSGTLKSLKIKAEASFAGLFFSTTKNVDR